MSMNPSRLLKLVSHRGLSTSATTALTGLSKLASAQVGYKVGVVGYAIGLSAITARSVTCSKTLSSDEQYGGKLFSHKASSMTDEEVLNIALGHSSPYN